MQSLFAENAALLRQYTFKERMQVKYKQKEVLARVSQITFDSDGTRQSTLINETHADGTNNKDRSGPALPSANLPDTGASRPLLHIVAKRLKESAGKKKAGEIKEYAAQMKTLLEEYLLPNREKLLATAPALERSVDGQNITLVARNYVKSGDSFRLTLDPATHQLRRIQVQTFLGKDPVSADVEMASISSRLVYVRLGKIESRRKDLEIDISEFDFRKQ